MYCRRWSHLPTGLNFGGVGYAHTNGDILFDPVQQIAVDLTRDLVRSSDLILTMARHHRVRTQELAEKPRISKISGLMNTSPPVM